MKAYIVLADVDGREVHLPLTAISAVTSLLSGTGTGVSTQVEVSSEKSPLLGREGAGISARTAKVALVANRYTPAFRAQAVDRYARGTETIRELANLLCMPYQTLDKWVRDQCGTTNRAFIKLAA